MSDDGLLVSPDDLVVEVSELLDGVWWGTVSERELIDGLKGLHVDLGGGLWQPCPRPEHLTHQQVVAQQYGLESLHAKLFDVPAGQIPFEDGTRFKGGVGSVPVSRSCDC